MSQNQDALKQMLPITDEVDLTGLGYEAGSQAHVVINPTKAWRRAWVEAVTINPHPEVKDDGGKVTQAAESAEAFEERLYAAMFALLPFIVTKVVLKVPGQEPLERHIGTAEDARFIEETDDRVLDLAVSEAQERGAARTVNARRSFRNGRLGSLTGRQEGQAPAAADHSDGADDAAD